MLLKGKEITSRLEENIILRVNNLESLGKKVTLGIVRVGESPSDIAYENSAVKKASKLGIESRKFVLSEQVSQDELVETIKSINKDDSIQGVLLFRPLPKHIDEDLVRNTLAPEKDLDGISDMALAGVFTGKDLGYPPCTAQACIEMLKGHNIEIKGKKAVVIGRSMVIGRPVAMMLMAENATVTITHTKTSFEDLIKYCKDADIIIASAGHINTVTSNMVTEKQVIVDVGINFTKDGKMCGDVDFENVCNKVFAITPVPGGVGSVTTTLLMEHLVSAAEKKN